MNCKFLFFVFVAVLLSKSSLAFVVKAEPVDHETFADLYSKLVGDLKEFEEYENEPTTTVQPITEENDEDFYYNTIIDLIDSMSLQQLYAIFANDGLDMEDESPRRMKRSSASTLYGTWRGRLERNANLRTKFNLIQKWMKINRHYPRGRSEIELPSYIEKLIDASKLRLMQSA